MRLLQCDENGQYTLTPDLVAEQIPRYAILSHTWGSEEVTFADVTGTSHDWQRKAGFEKIKFCGEQAKQHGLRYFWVDTCCINKADSTELQTAINSMFRWYRNAERCYVYLSDVSSQEDGQDVAFCNSRWFRRGWTLQELLAPVSVEFFSKEKVSLGDKKSLELKIRDTTGIPASALRGSPLSDFPITEREAWVQKRETTYEEDMAYSLLGIFNVFMPLIYGEGRENAFKRLRQNVQNALKGSRYDDFSVPFSLADTPDIQHFVGREKEMVELHRSLAGDGRRLATVLHGLGGIGKTQLAIAYAKRYKDHYSGVFWLNIKDENSVKQSFIKMARQILRACPTTGRLRSLELKGDQDVVVESVKAWLSLPGNTRWLLVFDNYDNPRLANKPIPGDVDIRQFLPDAYQGSIIITTRSSQVEIGYSIRIRTLESIDDSLKILSNASGRMNLEHDPHAVRLVEELDGLPLALATAGAYLRRVSTSFAQYLRLYKESWTKLQISTPSLGSYEDRTMCSTWQLSYDIIQKRHQSAAKLLQWWAYFDNQDIWYELLNHTNSESPTWMIELTRDELCFHNAMGTLHDYGLVETNTQGADGIESPGYNIHSCVHSWTINILNDVENESTDPDLAKLALECVASHVPLNGKVESWALRKRLIPHALRCRSIIQNRSYFNMEWAFNYLGSIYLDQGMLREAEDMYERTLKGYEKTLGPDHTSTFASFHSLGIVYLRQGKLKKADEVLVQALQGLEKLWGPDHMSTLNTVNILGSLYTDQGRTREAEEMYARVLEGYNKLCGPDHPSTLDAVNNLGILYEFQGKLQEAEQMYLRALAGREKVLGPDHTAIFSTSNNLGSLYSTQGKMKEAEEMYMRALDGYEKVIGPDHISTLDTVNDLGIFYAKQGKLQAAEETFLLALEGKEKALGPDHTSTLDTVNNLGLIYANQRKLREAEEMYLRALDGYTKILGTSDLYQNWPALNALQNLGKLFMNTGRFSDAHEIYDKALGGFEMYLGSSNARVENIRDTLDSLKLLMGNRSVVIEEDLPSSQPKEPVIRDLELEPQHEEQQRHGPSKARKSMQRLTAFVRRRAASMPGSSKDFNNQSKRTN